MKDIMIDENTYNQVNDNTLDSYENFIESNPIVDDYSSWLKKNKTSKSSVEITNQVKKRELDEKLKKDEDYRYIPSLVWMEMYLPRFEVAYGKFTYSKSDISNKQKCEELLKYYSSKCGVKKIDEIFKRRPHKGILR
ncbi:MAG: hypothetical protein J6G98_05590 [Bacilli bacterium]|nr:hypothetical protein [Bacilli bacterium]